MISSTTAPMKPSPPGKRSGAAASSAALALLFVALSARLVHSAAPPRNASLVGDGVISTRDYEQNSSFTADGRTLGYGDLPAATRSARAMTRYG